jgi:uncharacterized protein YciI
MERQQFIYTIEPVRPEMPVSPTDDEVKHVAAHFAYLKEQLGAGNLIMAGRTTEPPFVGIAIFEASGVDEASRFAEKDPGIQAGVFRLVGVQPYRVALLRQPPSDA